MTMFETTCKKCRHTYHFNSRGTKQCPHCSDNQLVSSVIIILAVFATVMAAILWKFA